MMIPIWRSIKRTSARTLNCMYKNMSPDITVGNLWDSLKLINLKVWCIKFNKLQGKYKRL
jgi:hypothetical protein